MEGAALAVNRTPFTMFSWLAPRTPFPLDMALAFPWEDLDLALRTFADLVGETEPMPPG